MDDGWRDENSDIISGNSDMKSGWMDENSDMKSEWMMDGGMKIVI